MQSLGQEARVTSVGQHLSVCCEGGGLRWKGQRSVRLDVYKMATASPWWRFWALTGVRMTLMGSWRSARTLCIEIQT